MNPACHDAAAPASLPLESKQPRGIPPNIPATAEGAPVLVIPGMEGATGVLAAAATDLFPGLRPVLFEHRLDHAEDGIDGLAERALSALDQQCPTTEPVLVAGESFGGTIALTLARRFPSRVRGLILLSTFARYPAVSACVAHSALALWRVLGDRSAHHVIRVTRGCAPRVTPNQSAHRVALAHHAWPPCYLPAYRAKAALCLRFDARPWLKSITCPTCIISGTRDPLVPVTASREMAHLLPHAELHCLPGDHGVHVSRAQEVGALISRWSAKVLVREGPRSRAA